MLGPKHDYYALKAFSIANYGGLHEGRRHFPRRTARRAMAPTPKVTTVAQCSHLRRVRGAFSTGGGGGAPGKAWRAPVKPSRNHEIVRWEISAQCAPLKRVRNADISNASSRGARGRSRAGAIKDAPHRIYHL
jgi:hypothetical protein